MPSVRKRCSADSCESQAVKGGVCVKHGAKLKPPKRCSIDGCEKYAINNGVCCKHGAKLKPPKRCSIDGCENGAKKGGVCIKHGAKAKRIRKRCSIDGCESQARVDGTCIRHHPDYVPLERISRGAFTVLSYLERIKIPYEPEKRFKDCRSIKTLPFDFYLPEHNLLIEYDGIQHVRPIDHWGGQLGLEYRQECDGIKNKYAHNNNIPLLRIPHTVPYSRIPFVVNRFIIENSI